MYSYIYNYLTHRLELFSKPLLVPFYVSTHMGDSLIVDLIYRDCVVRIQECDTGEDLSFLDMLDLILFCAWADYFPIEWSQILYYLSHVYYSIGRVAGFKQLHTDQIVSYVQAQRLVSSVYLPYFDYIHDVIRESPINDSVPIVHQFVDVIPTYLFGIPLECDNDFVIDIDLDTHLISITHYHKEPIELKDLNIQLQDLLGKVFLRQHLSFRVLPFCL